MAFYSKDKQGKSVSSQEASTLTIVPNQDAFLGFIPKATLELLLKPDSSVGIRIYNAFNNRTTDRLDKLVAVGVTDDGGEIQQTKDGESGYIVCGLQLNDNNGTNVSDVRVRHVPRDAARKAALGIISPARLGFASYFSAGDMEDLLNVPGCNGIILHAIKTELPGSQSLHNSHLAIAAQHIVDSNGMERLELIDKQMISLNPCPPHCAPENAPVSRTMAGNTTTAAAATQVSNAEIIKYLVPWS